MKIVLAPFYLLYKLWVGLVFWVTLMLLYPAFKILLQKEKWFPAAFRLKRFWSGLLGALFLCPVRSRFVAPLPKPPYIIVSNHSSHLDTVFMYRVFPEYFLFIGKGELLKWPLFSLFFKKMDIPVDRNNNKKAYNALQKAYYAIDKKECVAMYPEGTIPLTSPRMKAFKTGAFRMAMDKNVPIIPVTWQTNYRIMNNPEKIFSPSHPNVVKVLVHEAVYPTGTTEQDLIALRTEVFSIIDSGLPAKFQKTTDHL